MKENITFRFDKEIMDKLRRNAQLDNRTLNNYVETFLKRHLNNE
jgi:predicted HicB family RNase H-like nuclease